MRRRAPHHSPAPKCLNRGSYMNRILKISASICITFACCALLQAQSGGDVLIKNATVLTAARGTLNNTDVLVTNGKIAKIGKNLSAPANVRVIDATGKFVSPGIIDAHSHSMLDAINEGSIAVSSMTNVRDVLDPKDITIYRALAGGVTGGLLLHGSANPIGGQSVTVKFKYGHPVEDFPIAGAPPGIKFALGENVKRSNFQPQP